MNKIYVSTVLVFISSILICNPIFAAKTDAGSTSTKAKFRGGEIICGGYHRSQENYTVYGINNIDDTETINIDRMVIYNARDGSLFYDSNLQSPLDPNFKMSLGPHMRTRFISRNFITDGSIIDLQTFIHWSSESGNPVIPLRVGGARFRNLNQSFSLHCGVLDEY